ncbi:hypothetical protein PybrP1_005625 [[Pythium] brassicae (nom. inval.)]|nr:hypothetical protein PybrP1_005625 [[Pythium] brassicae (nom. inval.)]
MSSDDSTQVVGQFVWEKWRHVWYMGRVVEEQLVPAADCTSSSSSHATTVVKVHVHGEVDTNDKWFPLDSPNLVLVAVAPNGLAAVGAFPALHDYVELLQMDLALYDLLRPGRSGSQSPEDDVPLLVGTVVQALPAHDASVVDVLYPPAYHHVVQERRVHIGNGYLKVVTEGEFQERRRRLELTQ